MMWGFLNMQLKELDLAASASTRETYNYCTTHQLWQPLGTTGTGQQTEHDLRSAQHCSGVIHCHPVMATQCNLKTSSQTGSHDGCNYGLRTVLHHGKEMNKLISRLLCWLKGKSWPVSWSLIRLLLLDLCCCLIPEYWKESLTKWTNFNCITRQKYITLFSTYPD